MILQYIFCKEDVADDPHAYQQPEEDDEVSSNNDDSTNNDDLSKDDDFTRALDLLAQKRREKEADGMNHVFKEIEEQRKVRRGRRKNKKERLIKHNFSRAKTKEKTKNKKERKN